MIFVRPSSLRCAGGRPSAIARTSHRSNAQDTEEAETWDVKDQTNHETHLYRRPVCRRTSWCGAGYPSPPSKIPGKCQIETPAFNAHPPFAPSSPVMSLRGGAVLEPKTLGEVDGILLKASAEGKLVVIDFSATCESLLQQVLSELPASRFW